MKLYLYVVRKIVIYGSFDLRILCLNLFFMNSYRLMKYFYFLFDYYLFIKVLLLLVRCYICKRDWD